jgi:hypothetical protein
VKPRLAVAAMLLTTLSPTAMASAQSAMGAPVIGATVAWESYTFADPAAAGIRSIALLTAPFAVRLRNSAIGLELGGAWASGTLVREDGTSSTLSGPTDIDVRAFLAFGRDRVVVAVTGAAPTGRSALRREEAEVAGVISADLLPFRISNWGSGGGLGASALVAVPVAGFGVGVSGGYRVAREFEPLDGEALVYRPGDELSIRAAVDRSIGAAGKLAFQVAVQRYADDAIGGENLYRSGNRTHALGSWSFAAGGQGSGAVYAGVLRRARGTYLDRTEVTPAQDLVLLGGGVRRQAGGVVLMPSVDARFFRSADGVGQGYAAGVGGSVELPLGGATLIPAARLRIGRVLVREDAETGLTGFDLGFTARLGR